jgi:transcriptional regulator with XRE-family HTH domain
MTRLQKYLEERGIKQKWLCDKTGISDSAMSLIVRGKAEPTLRNARKIAKALGMTIEELWPEEEEKENQPE